MSNLDLIYHVFNFFIAFCYYIIFAIIFTGLIKEKAVGRNLLGTVTAGIFFTCGLGHTIHALSQHLHSDRLMASFQVFADGITIIPAISYVILRRRYGLIIRGADMISEFETRLKESQTEVKNMRELEKLKDEFLAIASHELKTPLTVIKSYTQLLNSHLNHNLEPASRKILLTMNEQVNRMNNLIVRLLDFNRIQAKRFELKIELCDFSRLLSDTIERLQVTIPTHKLNFCYQEFEQLLVRIDRTRFEQVIENLITNAVKYSPDAEKVDIFCYRQGNRLCLTVKDYGIGINSQDLPKLFERYYRANSVQKGQFAGLGLGLYISHEVIKACNGNITVEAEPGKGSIFKVEIPLADLRTIPAVMTTAQV